MNSNTVNLRKTKIDRVFNASKDKICNVRMYCFIPKKNKKLNGQILIYYINKKYHNTCNA